MSLIKITILYFAQTSDITGKKIEKTKVKSNTNISDLFFQLITRYPRLKEIEKSLQISVNRKIVKKNFEIKDGDEIALLPPISGG